MSRFHGGLEKSIFLAAITTLLFCWTVSTASADSCTDALPANLASSAFFVKSDQRSILQRALSAAGFSGQTSPGFALVAGVSEYPLLPVLQQDLKPAGEDILKLANYLKDQEHFDEVVVLMNTEMTDLNLQYFLQDYFPCRLEARRPEKPRFLFAYSGHGVTIDGVNGFLLTSKATSLTARPLVNQSIDLKVLRAQFQSVVDAGYQTLALINACYSGSFIKQSFGGRPLPPRREGAFAITAGGSDELTWHDDTLGSGSIFFEFLFRGLDGRIHSNDDADDGIVSADEIAAYLKTNIRLFSEDNQNPRSADLIPGGSAGGFFFLDRRKQNERKIVPVWSLKSLFPFGNEYKNLDQSKPREPAAAEPRLSTDFQNPNQASVVKAAPFDFCLRPGEDEIMPLDGPVTVSAAEAAENAAKAAASASNIIGELRKGNLDARSTLIAERGRSCSREFRVAVQNLLKGTGYYSHGVDGYFGPATIAALNNIWSGKK